MTEITKNNEFSSLIDLIDCYIDDDKRRYAIAIEGEWGSGKTHFIEEELRKHLKEKNKRLVRASLFGVSASAELYARILASWAHLEETKKSRAKALVKSSISVAAETISNLARKIGISLDPITETDLLVNLVLQDKCILVLDDIERHSLRDNADTKSLFGAINDLVENKGLKVILLMNESELSSITDFDKSIREKLIWTTYHFCPSPNYLMTSILNTKMKDIGGEETISVICDAAELANCHNARAIIRAKLLLESLTSLPSLQNTSIADENRISAFRDCARFALLYCMGEEPQPPEEPSASDNSFATMLEYASQRDLYEQYQECLFIANYFQENESVPLDDLDYEMQKYINARYPESAETFIIKNTRSKINPDLSDNEAQELMQEFFNAVETEAFNPISIHDVTITYGLFIDLGFVCPIEQNEFIEICKRSIDRCSFDEIKILNQWDYWDMFASGKTAKALMPILQESAKEAYVKKFDSLSSENEGNADKIIEMIEDARSYNRAALSSIPANSVVEAFTNETPQKQNKLRNTFKSLGSYLPSNLEETEHIYLWLQEIKVTLDKLPKQSTMNELRKSYFSRNLDDLLSQLKPKDKF